MALEGSLRDFNLLDILQLICMGRRTGALNVRGRINLGVVYFKEGEVIHATISNLKLYGEEAVYQILGWREGSFNFDASAQIPFERTIETKWENLIMEGARRLDELSKVREAIPSPDVVFRFSGGTAERSKDINLTPDEWKVLRQVNGQRNVKHIAFRCGLSELETMHILYNLISLKLIEVVPRASLPPVVKEEAISPQKEEKEEERKIGSSGPFR